MKIKALITLGPLRSCTICLEVKTLGEFSTNKTCVNGKSHRCRDCDSRDRQNKHLLSKYGITYEQKKQMLLEQGDSCTICLKEFVTDFNTVVDHDHETGKIRSLLCRQCNAGLGSFYEDRGSLSRAVKYLEEHGG